MWKPYSTTHIANEYLPLLTQQNWRVAEFNAEDLEEGMRGDAYADAVLHRSYRKHLSPVVDTTRLVGYRSLLRNSSKFSEMHRKLCCPAIVRQITVPFHFYT